jgi:hypothetical protein
MWCMASEAGFNSRNAFVYIQGSYNSKNIAKARWSVHLCLGGTPMKQAFSTVFDPQQLLERDATEPHTWPNVYLADALLREPIKIVRAQPEQTVALGAPEKALCMLCGIVPVSPTGTKGSLPRIL